MKKKIISILKWLILLSLVFLTGICTFAWYAYDEELVQAYPDIEPSATALVAISMLGNKYYQRATAELYLAAAYYSDAEKAVHNHFWKQGFYWLDKSIKNGNPTPPHREKWEKRKKDYEQENK